MAFLTIASVTVEMSTFRQRDPVRVGETVRTFAGGLRSSVRATTKRQWDGTTIPMTPADVATLVTAMGGRARLVTVAGDAVDSVGGFTAYVTIAGADYLATGATSHHRTLSVTVEEV